ncbi:hypothetical protein F5X96DRAFT_661193, partial [Biscogniauxia mediterranea]
MYTYQVLFYFLLYFFSRYLYLGVFFFLGYFYVELRSSCLSRLTYLRSMHVSSAVVLFANIAVIG